MYKASKFIDIYFSFFTFFAKKTEISKLPKDKQFKKAEKEILKRKSEELKLDLRRLKYLYREVFLKKKSLKKGLF